MKKLMLALAAACAIGFSAVADATDWFNGGIGDDWPTNTALKGGVWTNTDGCSWNGSVVDIKSDSDPEQALTFNATEEKDLAGNTVTITTKFTFTPYSYNIEKGIDTRPSIPAGAKAGVILVSTNDVGEVTADEECTLWYIAYDDSDNVKSNVWTESTVSSVKITTTKPVKVTISNGDAAGFYKVQYNFQGKTFDATVYAPDSTTVGTVVCAGTGTMSEFYSTYEIAAASTLTIGDFTGSNMSVTNVSVNGELQGVAESYTIPYGADVVVFFKPDEGWKFTGDNTYIIKGMTENVEVNKNTEGIPSATEIETATLTFYAPDYETTKEYTDEVGKPWSYGDEVNAWVSNQVSVGYALTGVWMDEDQNPVPLPTEYVEDTEYYSSATAITYRVGTEAAGTGVNVLFDGEVVTEYNVNSGYETDVVEVSGDPTSDPTGAKRKFLGWTCEYFDITTPFKADAQPSMVMPDDFDSWEKLGDIIFVANWEEAPQEDVSMYFYDYDYDSEFEEGHLIHTEEGVEGAAWTQDTLLEAANDPENQPTGKWFDGTWTDTDRVATELPGEIVKDAKFVMSVTNITYYIRQDFDGGEGEEDPTYEINEDMSQEITLVEPTKSGATFKAWEVVGDLPEGISIDGATISIDANAIGDVNVKATWEAVVETYTITIAEPENGTLETSVTNNITAGTTVTVTATPAEGYQLVSITTNDVALAENETTFVMPADDVTVAATFTLKPADPFPEPEASDDPIEEAANVENALDEGGFSDTAKDNITTKDEYDEFKAYCQNTLEITAPGGTTGNVKDNAYLSYALDAGKIDKALAADDVTVDAFEATDGGYNLTIAIDGVTVGENVTAEKIATVVEITANTTLDVAGFSADNASVSGHCESAGKIKVTVAPAEGTPSAFFYKSAIKK